MTIRTQMVSHGLLPPASAATRCVQVATGPYTEGVVRHRGSTRATYGLCTPPFRLMGRKVYGSYPSAAIRPYAARLAGSELPTGVMFTTTATTATADQKTRRGFGCQPRLLAHSIPARPRQQNVIAGYMMKLVTVPESTGAPRRRVSALSGSSTGSVASLAPGAVAHSPTKASSPSPSADSDTAGSGRASGLDFIVRMRTPISASTRPPGIGGSASCAAAGSDVFVAAGSDALVAAGSDALVTGPRVIASPRASVPEPAPRARRPPRYQGIHDLHGRRGWWGGRHGRAEDKVHGPVPVRCHRSLTANGRIRWRGCG